MQATSNAFRANARVGLANPTLQSALGKMKVGFPTKRAEAVAKQLALVEPELAVRVRVLEPVAVSTLRDGWLPLQLELDARP